MSQDTTPTTATAEAAFSANFKLFDPEGVQTQFTVRAQTPAEHLAALGAYRAELAAQGYAPSEPSTGAEDGEKVEEVAAYVRGTTKAGQALIWLYAAKEVLKWRLATVYEEHLGELPFAVAGQVWPGAAAPEREEAAKKGYLIEVPLFKIVLAENGQTDDGKPRFKYARVYGATAALAAPANGNGHAAPVAPANGAGHPAPAPADAAPASTPACPKCGGPVWDNRVGKKNPAAPDFKCKDKACDGAIWPPKANGNGNGAKAPLAANGSSVPF